MKNPLIVALDHPDPKQIISWATDFGPHVGMVKIGLEAYCQAGPDLVRTVSAHAPVFLDLKLHDIPNTVAGAARACNTLGVQLLTVHAAGGPAMIEAAVAAAPDVKIIAVTVLTSIDTPTLSAIGQDEDVNAQVTRLARMAVDAGAAGVVCAAPDLPTVRAAIGSDPITVVPGIRPAGAEIGDQKRVATPDNALSLGATYLVVGRPITCDPNPVQVIGQLIQ